MGKGRIHYEQPSICVRGHIFNIVNLVHATDKDELQHGIKLQRTLDWLIQFSSPEYRPYNSL